jgi:hypothetical protein
MQSLAIQQIVIQLVGNSGRSVQLIASATNQTGVVRVSVSETVAFEYDLNDQDSTRAMRAYIAKRLCEPLDAQDWGSIIGRLIQAFC